MYKWLPPTTDTQHETHMPCTYLATILPQYIARLQIFKQYVYFDAHMQSLSAETTHKMANGEQWPDIASCLHWCGHNYV